MTSVSCAALLDCGHLTVGCRGSRWLGNAEAWWLLRHRGRHCPKEGNARRDLGPRYHVSESCKLSHFRSVASRSDNGSERNPHSQDAVWGSSSERRGVYIHGRLLVYTPLPPSTAPPQLIAMTFSTNSEKEIGSPIDEKRALEHEVSSPRLGREDEAERAETPEHSLTLWQSLKEHRAVSGRLTTPVCS